MSFRGHAIVTFLTGIAFLAGTTAFLRAAEPLANFRPEFHKGPLQLTGGGFLEYMGGFRTEPTGASPWTRFERLPLAPTPGNETFSTLTHSRITLDGAWKLSNASINGYFEADFQERRNKGPLRIRQAYGEYQHGDWSVAAGQMWSFLRPNRHAISSRHGLMNTLVADPSYHIGLMGNRLRQVRVTRRIGNWNAGVAWEEGGRYLTKITHESKRLHWEAATIASAGGRLGLSIAAAYRLTPKIDLLGQQYIGRRTGGDSVASLDEALGVSSTIIGIESRIHPRLQVYGYAGTILADRTARSRRLDEATAGFAYRLLSDALGHAALNVQFSVMDRRGPTSPGQSPGYGKAGIFMISLRHTLAPHR